MKTREGDLIALAEAGEFDVLVHGCNCQNTMGKGFARIIKERFPEAYQADLKTVKGDRAKLGTYSAERCDRSGRELTIVNAYTQFNWRGKGLKADYDAIRAVFKLIKRDFAGKRIGFPKIGAGLAGGDWEQIASIIQRELDGEDYTLVVFPG